MLPRRAPTRMAIRRPSPVFVGAPMGRVSVRAGNRGPGPGRTRTLRSRAPPRELEPFASGHPSRPRHRRPCARRCTSAAPGTRSRPGPLARGTLSGHHRPVHDPGPPPEHLPGRREPRARRHPSHRPGGISVSTIRWMSPPMRSIHCSIPAKEKRPGSRVRPPPGFPPGVLGVIVGVSLDEPET